MNFGPSVNAAAAEGRALAATFTPLDWVLLGVAAWSVLRGLLHGAIRELFALLAAVAALLTAYWEYRPAAALLASWIASAAARDVVAFLLVACLVYGLVALVGRTVRRLARLVGLGLVDRLAGGVLGLARAAVVCTLLLSAVAAFLPASPWVAQSRLAPPLAHAAKLLAGAAPPELERRIAAGVGNLLRLAQTLR